MIKVIEYKKKYFNEVVNLYMETYSRPPWSDKWESRDVVTTFFKAHIANNYFLCFLAFKDNTLVAVSLGYKKPWIEGMEYYIDEFFVKFNYQGQNIGSSFMETIFEKIKEKKLNAVILNTIKGYPAEKFYRKLDFFAEEDTIIFDKYV